MRRAVLAALLVCAGCIPTLPHGKPRLPNRAVPDTYGGHAESTNTALLEWSDFFSDPKLAALIELALKNNQELNIVALEIDVAQTEIMSRRGEYLPKVDFGLGVGIEKVGRTTSKGVSDEAHGVPEHLPEFSFGFSASWEIDIWSKLRNATKAATLRYLATQQGRNFAVTLLVGEMASAYYELLALDAQLEVVKQNLEIQQRGLEVVRLQKEAARVTELPVKRFEAELLKNQSKQYTLQQQIVENENRINFLAGRFPQHVDRSAQAVVDLVPAVVHTGLPAQLLENRPDVKEAELGLLASELDVRVAKASFYPSLGLGAMIGYQSYDFLKVVSTPASLAYTLAAHLVAPLFNRAAITATYFATNAKQMQAVLKFERAILNGYAEVTKYLALIQNLEKSYELKTQEVERLTASIDISNRLFASARADYMEVLMTRRDALESQMELIETKKRQMTAAVALYQALGGGWR